MTDAAERLAALVRRMLALGEKLGLPACSLPGTVRPEQGAHPWIEATAAGYALVTSERGLEIERRETAEAEELLYWVFEGVTFSMAVEYEFRRRQGEQDCRRVIFARQVELLGVLAPEWAARRAAEQAAILERHPYDDLAGLRAEYASELRAAGLDEEEISRRIYERYPPPTLSNSF